MKDESEKATSRGIQSLDAALQLLNAMAAFPGPATLTDLARTCKMPPSKVHRYLASFQKAGLCEQAGRSGKYDLGPGALRLGLAAMARHDFINKTAEALPDLCAETGLTALLSVWGDRGATVIRWERAPSPIVTSMGLGTTLPLLTSATGRAFLAWGAQAPMKAFRAAELRRHRREAIRGVPENAKEMAELVSQIRAGGFASVDGRYIPGLVAIAAPILDWQGEAQAVVTLIGTDPLLAGSDSEPVAKLIEFCRNLSISP